MQNSDKGDKIQEEVGGRVCRLKEDTPPPLCFSPLPLLPPVSCEGPGGGTHRLSEAPWVPQAGERAILWVRRFLWMFPPQNGIGHGHFVRSFVVIILCGFLECL